MMIMLIISMRGYHDDDHADIDDDGYTVIMLMVMRDVAR